MSRYDFWLTTTPEDEDDAAAAREARQEAAAERACEAAQDPPEPVAYAYSVGPSDLAERNRAEAARLARLFGNDWTEGLPV